MARRRSVPRIAVCLTSLAAFVATAGVMATAWSPGAQAPPAKLTPLTRAPQAEIQEHLDREWVKTALVHDLLDYWLKNSIEPNGFIQENLDRQWKPWGTQREASINGQGRQLFTMAIGYELTKEKSYLDGLTRGMDFLMKMRDPEYGGYYDRVAPDLTVINGNKTGFSSFALYSLAHAGRVTGNKKYLDAAMVLFREVRDKMRDGPFIGSGSYERDFMKAGASPFGGGGRGGAAAGPGAAGGGQGAAAGAPQGARGQGGAGGPGGPGTGMAARRHGINLHMFEALLGLYEATKSEEVWYADHVGAEGHRATL